MYLGSITINRYNPSTEECQEETWEAYGSASRYQPATRHSTAEGGIEEVEEMRKGEESLSFEDFLLLTIEDAETHPDEERIIEELYQQYRAAQEEPANIDDSD